MRLPRVATRLGGLLRRRPAAPPGPFRPDPAAPRPRLEYAPKKDGRADPGEVVWAWVAYEDDPDNGKDRPVLIVARDSRLLVGCYLSSNPSRDGRPGWLALGPGPWDRAGRSSWIRLDRPLWLTEKRIRREGALLDRERFERVAAALRRDHGWS